MAIGWITKQNSDVNTTSRLHEKLWQIENDARGPVDRELTEVWRQKIGRMEGFYVAQAEKKASLDTS